MSLRHSPEGHIDRAILLAAAAAIRSIEKVSGAIEEYDIGKGDAELLGSALDGLWSILETNGYTIDIETNRLRRTTRDN
ncbi:hypothetical protein [Geobacter sp. AOG2]|uniref:hypothetical protein n=1 Tax=Geobacter sp. AOG2 TaxID=1566347 RepID=UPI001CC51BDA|nr:hypothetical protein [Geobacter sp. AOG2]GFE60804.1 hypothetical protein AOG2_13920 [Geobacter sp. AOG2]